MDRAHAHLLRQGRFSQPDGLYLLTTVTHERQPLFTNLFHARAVIAQMRQSEREHACKSLAWVVMPDHVHWLVELKSATLGSLMRRFKSRSSHALYQLGMPRSKVWQAGYQDRALRREESVRVVAEYIIGNPLRAELVDQVGDYPHWDTAWT